MIYRKPKPQISLLTKAEHNNLMLLPYVHLALVLEGSADRQHVHTLAGLFNIAGALASYRHNHKLLATINEAQGIVTALLRGETSLLDAHKPILRTAVNRSRAYLEKASRADLARTVAWVDTQIAKGNAEPIEDTHAND